MELEEEIRKHYASRRLSPEAVARIQSAPVPRASSRFRASRSPWLAAAAAVLLAVGVALWSNFQGPGTEHPMAARLRVEVVLNHEKYPRPEIQTGDLALLAADLNRKVGFDLNRAASGLPAGFQLEGGRKCSLLGKPAAQIHLTRNGKVQGSLYVTTSPVLPPGTPFTAGWQNGYHVRTWESRGMFYALAATPAP